MTIDTKSSEFLFSEESLNFFFLLRNAKTCKKHFPQSLVHCAMQLQFQLLSTYNATTTLTIL